MNIFRRYTLKSLWQNRTRTIVTIVGIILSVAMITAVTTTVSSIQNFMLETTIQNDGCWHLSFMENKKGSIEEVLSRKEIDQSAKYADVAFARLDSVKKERTPYLYIGGFSGNFPELLSVNITEGRLPENSHELILPSDIGERSGIAYKTGQKLQLDTGVRKEKETGAEIWEETSYSVSGDRETFVPEGKGTYEIVGFYESARFGYWGSFQGLPGYPALTRLDASAGARGQQMVYMTIKEPDETSEFQAELQKEFGEENLISTNRFYLQISGENLGDSLVGMLAGLMAVLIGIIMFGSISLIYNSFAISVNERKKQYGLLSSIGATRRQLKKSVLFEAVMVSIIGVPLGVLAGIGGMGVTFYCLRDTFSSFLGTGNLTIHVSAALWSVVAAAVVGFVTVLISAWLPVRKALKINAIEAIRQTTDIVVKPRKLKTSRLTVKLFGLEGVLATKNYKRNKRKYRATVFSLFISVVLFISATSFSDYLSTGLDDIINKYSSDLRYSSTVEGTAQNDEKYEELFGKFTQIAGVTEAYYNFNLWNESMVTVPGKYLSDSVYRNSTGEKKPGDLKELEKPVEVSNVNVTFVQDAVYKEYLEKNHLDVKCYMDTKNPTALVYDSATVWNTDEERYENVETFMEKPDSLQLSFEVWPMDEGEGDGTEEEIEPEIIGKKLLTIGEVRKDTPPGLDSEKEAGLLILYPAGAREAVCPAEVRKKLSAEYAMSICADNPNRCQEEMQEIMDAEDGGEDGFILNIAEQIKASRALMLILNIFSLGFIILISLIAVANVFNTISTNVFLRRREFAMLRSVGMTQRSFRKMTNFECLLYGVKGLVYGLPVAVGITALIWKAMNSEIQMSFYIPWYSIVIAVGSVFLVVFSTMLYAMSKIRKDNVVDTLKEENY
ncbi:MAG: ABC transporter permease [Eubacterium sp.]|jgi:ABC-type antimicrobial peptide transport system, permease component|nr:ABC transporter permease [Eubacterium sp.]